MAGTCAGYDDTQISCEHGGEEGGQNVSLSTLLFSVNSWGAWSKDELVVVVARLPVLLSFLLSTPFSYFIHFPASVIWFIIHLEAA